jgi:hypothetical protein
MNREDPESQNNEENQDQTEIKRARGLTKCCRVVILLLILSLMGWIISLIVRQKYKINKPVEPSPEQLILKSLLYATDLKDSSVVFGHFTLSGNTYIKYFAKRGENPMHCIGSYCWPWQTPDRVVCSIENNAKPWQNNAAWACEAMVPDGYNLDTVQITCSEDPSIALNPHLGCNLVYSMTDDSYISEIDWESLGIFISTLGLCFIVFFTVIVCSMCSPGPRYQYSTYPRRNTRIDTCDVLICFALLEACCSRGRHSSRTWG